jgi:hypothetical protein
MDQPLREIRARFERDCVTAGRDGGFSTNFARLSSLCASAAAVGRGAASLAQPGYVHN